MLLLPAQPERGRRELEMAFSLQVSCTLFEESTDSEVTEGHVSCLVIQLQPRY